MACRISGGCAGSSRGGGANDARAWVLCAARCLALDSVTFLETNGRRPGLDSQRRAAGRTAAPEIWRRPELPLGGPAPIADPGHIVAVLCDVQLVFDRGFWEPTWEPRSSH